MPNSANPLPAEFFVNKVPPVPTITEATTAKVDLIEPAKEPDGNASVEDQN